MLFVLIFRCLLIVIIKSGNNFAWSINEMFSPLIGYFVLNWLFIPLIFFVFFKVN